MSEDGRREANDAAVPSKLAGRFLRLFAVIIDGLIGCTLMLPLFWYLHFRHDVTPRMQSAIVGAAVFATFAVINYRLLEKRGQTVGKWFVGVAIVGLDGSNKGVVHLLIYRYALEMLFGWVPFVGWIFGLADPLAIFGRERRCLHDLIAGTKVIEIE